MYFWRPQLLNPLFALEECLRFKITSFVRIEILLVFVLYALFLAWSAYLVYAHDSAYLYKENGLIENMQVAALVIGCIVFFMPVVWPIGRDKLLHLFFSFLCYSFILRELDIERFDVPEIVKFIGSGVGRDVSYAIGFLSLMAYALWHFSYYKARFKDYARSASFFLFLASGVVLFLGGSFEDFKSVPHHVYIEEIVELAGFSLLVVSALFLYKQPI